ncbi:uncharacterized protein UHOD_12165 [Ustilago sp. UG-2017b]|nr:uncharacterized protein UHOD_12165 [Ustilago sp. UG-2017b]
MSVSREAEGSLDPRRGVCLDGESGREGSSIVQERGIEERLVSVGVMVKGVGPIEDRLDEEEKGKWDEDEAAAVVAATEEQEDEITLAPMGSFCDSSRMDSMPGMLRY